MPALTRRLLRAQTRPLPERFEDVQQFRHKPVKQHPMYRTSNNQYGVVKPSQEELPKSWHGVTVSAAPRRRPR